MDNPITQLTETVISEITARGEAPPDRNILATFFNVAFYCTLERDEGIGIRFDATYLDPNNPDPDPPFYVRSDRWIVVPFAQPLDFSKSSITKVALATDRRTSLLLVYPDSSNSLKIWGFIDQGTNTYNLRTLESDHGFHTPGLFQVSAVDGGHIVVRIGFEQIAELRGEELATKPLDVFTQGALPDALASTFSRLASASRKYAPRYGIATIPAGVEDEIGDRTLASLRRLLLRIQSYSHGGAVLITPSIRAKQLNIKHRIEYVRLAQAIEKTSLLDLYTTELYDELSEIYHSEEKLLDVGLHLHHSIAKNEQEDAESELNGALWFVSLLSRIDGLVLADTALTVRGFGVEILVQKSPDRVWLAGDQEGNSAFRTEFPYERYGTRHRSMMRYVSSVPGSIGFVVSQDGGVRVMTLIGTDLVIWNNVQLQLDFELKRNIPITEADEE